MEDVLAWLRQICRPNTILLLSGGSAAKVFAPAWQALSQEEQAAFTLSLIDERFGFPGHPDSNWTLLEHLGVDLSDKRHIPVLGADSLQACAGEWQDALQQALDAADQITAIFGIGEDHHIAGIKPDSPASTEQDQLVVGYKWDDYDRITTTPLLFPRIDNAILYAEGANKAAAIDAINGNLDPVQYPSQLIKLCKEYTIYYKA